MASLSLSPEHHLLPAHTGGELVVAGVVLIVGGVLIGVSLKPAVAVALSSAGPHPSSICKDSD